MCKLVTKCHGVCCRFFLQNGADTEMISFVLIIWLMSMLKSTKWEPIKRPILIASTPIKTKFKDIIIFMREKKQRNKKKYHVGPRNQDKKRSRQTDVTFPQTVQWTGFFFLSHSHQYPLTLLPFLIHTHIYVLPR